MVGCIISVFRLCRFFLFSVLVVVLSCRLVISVW